MTRLIEGAKIIALREAKQLTQQQLSQLSGVNGSVISRLERNMQTDFKLSVIANLAKALETTIDELMVEAPQADVREFEPELKAALQVLRRQSPFAQKQLASIIMAYISTSTQSSSDES